MPTGELEVHALTLAHNLANKPRAALMAARARLRGDTSAITTAMEQEGRHYVRLMGSPEAREAFTSCVEKRKPDFAAVRAAAQS